MATIEQNKLLQLQEEEQKQNAIELTIPALGAPVEVSNQAGTVSESGGVPASRTVAGGQKLKAAEQQRLDVQTHLQGLDPELNKSDFAKATAALGQLDSVIDTLSKPSAPLESRKGGKVYATGNSHGFLVNHSSTGKMKDIMFLNGPGISETPTLQDVFRMNTEQGASSAAIEMRAAAADATKRWTAEARRNGMSLDALGQFGEYIQSKRQEDFLSARGVQRRIFSNVEDNKVMNRTIMKELFGPDFKEEDLNELETTTVDVKQNEADRDAVANTLLQAYETFKDDPNRTARQGDIKFNLMETVLNTHKDYVDGLGKNRTMRFLDNLSTTIDQMRRVNYQKEVQLMDMRKIQEEQTIMDNGMNEIASTFAFGTPRQKNKILRKAAEEGWVTADNADQLVNIVGSESVARHMEEIFEGADDLLDTRSGVNIPDLSEDQAFNLVGQAVAFFIGRQLGDDTADTHHIYADIARKIRNQVLDGTIYKNKPLAELITNLTKQYTLGQTMERVEQQKLLNKQKQEDAKQLSEMAKNVNAGLFIKRAKADGTLEWGSGTDAQQRKGFKQMLHDDEKWGRFSGGIIGSDEIRLSMLEKIETMEMEEIAKGINSFRRGFAPILGGVRTVGSAGTAAAQRAGDKGGDSARRARASVAISKMQALTQQLNSQVLPINTSRDKALAHLEDARQEAIKNGADEEDFKTHVPPLVLAPVANLSSL